jgi:DNA-binding transcriptional ArsR family regulator
MKVKESIGCLSALAQETRLEVFRLLVRMGEAGAPAGRIADRLGANATTLSRHLAVMEQAGLVEKERHARQIIYRVKFDRVQALFAYLIEDCCAGDPRVTGERCAQADNGPEKKES